MNLMYKSREKRLFTWFQGCGLMVTAKLSQTRYGFYTAFFWERTAQLLHYKHTASSVVVGTKKEAKA